MLIELVVTDLGVVEHARLLLGPGLIALTGETGAGKTMVVTALGLLTGGRADSSVVRAGADEAIVEGRFVTSDDAEVVLTRVVPADGRSRAYVDGRAASSARLAELTADLVEVATQHAHHRLLSPASRRRALDDFGGIDLDGLRAAEVEVARLTAELDDLGGDDRARARELDLLRFQLDELDAAAIDDPDEDETLAREEERLADAEALIETASSAAALLGDEDGAADLVRRAGAALGGRAPVAELAARVQTLVADLDEVVTDLRRAAESFQADPARLDQVQARRRLLSDLCRKYGEDLGAVLAEHKAVADRLARLESHDETAARLAAELELARTALGAEQASVAAARAAQVEPLADAVGAHLADLALGGARFGCEVAGPAGDDVAFLLAANPGEPFGPVERAASGGELARVMLALHLVLSGGAPTMVFDEVDAGVGGAAGAAVGRALARLAREPQVLVVTHLPQVAAFADQHLVVSKHTTAERTRSEVVTVDGPEREAELARMLAGRGDSETARTHAAELLAEAAGLHDTGRS